MSTERKIENFSQKEKAGLVFAAFNHFAQFYNPATGADLPVRNPETQRHAKIILRLEKSNKRELLIIIANLDTPYFQFAAPKHENFDAVHSCFVRSFDDAICGLDLLLRKAEGRSIRQSNFSYSRYWCNVFTGRPGQKFGIAGLALGTAVTVMSYHLTPILPYLPVIAAIPPAKLLFLLGLTILALAAAIYGISMLRGACSRPYQKYIIPEDTNDINLTSQVNTSHSLNH